MAKLLSADTSFYITFLELEIYKILPQVFQMFSVITETTPSVLYPSPDKILGTTL